MSDFEVHPVGTAARLASTLPTRETVAAIVGDAIYGPTRRDTYRHVTLPCADKILAATERTRGELPAEVYDFVSRTCLLATNAGGWFDKTGFKAISPLCDAANAILETYERADHIAPVPPAKGDAK